MTNLQSMVKHWLINNHHWSFWPLLGCWTEHGWRMFKERLKAHFCDVSLCGMKNQFTSQTNSISQYEDKIPVSPSFVQMWFIFLCQSFGHDNKPGVQGTPATLGSATWFKFAARIASSTLKVVLLSWCQPVYHSDLHFVPSVSVCDNHRHIRTISNRCGL